MKPPLEVAVSIQTKIPAREIIARERGEYVNRGLAHQAQHAKDNK